MKSTIKKILISYLIVICCIITPTQQANANAYGVAVTVAQWVNNAVQISATVGGAYRTVMISPKSPQVAALILAGAGGAYVGNYIYKKYGDNVVSWAWDATHQNIDVKLKTGAVTGCVVSWPEVSAVGASMQDIATNACSSIGATAPIFTNITATSLHAVCDAGNGANLDVYCGAVGNDVQIPVNDIANAAIADAATDADARKLVVDATAANVKPTDFTDAANNPTTNDTTFDPSSILAAIQSLFAMLQNLLTNLLDAIKSLAQAIFKPIVDIIQSVWDWAKDAYQWIKDTAVSWKDAVVTEYKDVKDKVTHYFTDDPVMTDTPVQTADTPLKNPADFDKDYINVIAQCPPDVVREIPLPGQSFNLVFVMSPVCDFASTYLRPVIIFLAYIYGALSIGNAFRVGG